MSATRSSELGHLLVKGFVLPAVVSICGMLLIGAASSADLPRPPEEKSAQPQLPPKCDDENRAHLPECSAAPVNSWTKGSGGAWRNGQGVGQIGNANVDYFSPGNVPATAGWSNDDAPATIRASRLFSAPAQFPPKDFRAYGIVAFPSRATSHDRNRHVMICEAYVAALPHADDLSNQPRSNQMVTIWPVDALETARELNEIGTGEGCPKAVDGYSLVAAQQAILEARRTGLDLSSRGPFLLAWSPSTSKGKDDALVLVADLSDVETPERSLEIMRRWTMDIEKDPDLWDNGWDLELLRVKLRDWVDDVGPKILGTVGF